MSAPETRYAKSGDISIAYQVSGSGPLDLIFVPGFVSNLDIQWEAPGISDLFHGLGRFARLIRFDKRGTGLSDRIAGIPNLDERMDDVRAVMDAVGSKRAAIFGVSEGGPMSLLFSATYPDRVSGLVLYGSFARHPQLTDPAYLARNIADIERLWGTGEYMGRSFFGSPVTDSTILQRLAQAERQSASPSAAIAILRMNSVIDTRHILPAIRTPTLVMHREGDSRVPIMAGRYIADHVPGARLVTLPGVNHQFTGEPEIGRRMAAEAEEFLTGVAPEVEIDRVLATVMFTDIVDSTRRAVELGDRQWRGLVERHNGILRDQIARFRGRAIKSLGDGFLATFDGPARAVRCAASIAGAVHPLGIDVRVGLHTGEIELHGDDIAGIAVHTAARVAALAGPGTALVSSTVRDLAAGSGLRFEDRGRHALKGLPEQMQLYAAMNSASA
jgi:class 3 adenylate cyclase